MTVCIWILLFIDMIHSFLKVEMIFLLENRIAILFEMTFGFFFFFVSFGPVFISELFI